MLSSRRQGRGEACSSLVFGGRPRQTTFIRARDTPVVTWETVASLEKDLWPARPAVSSGLPSHARPLTVPVGPGAGEAEEPAADQRAGQTEPGAGEGRPLQGAAAAGRPQRRRQVRTRAPARPTPAAHVRRVLGSGAALTPGRRGPVGVHVPGLAGDSQEGAEGNSFVQ